MIFQNSLESIGIPVCALSIKMNGPPCDEGDERGYDGQDDATT